MSELPEGTEQAEAGEGDPVDPPPPFQLDGRDILARTFMAVLQKGMHTDPQKFDVSTEILLALKQITENEIGPFAPSPWFCINLENYQVGRAYPYKGEHRIVPVVPDFGMIQDIDGVVNSDEGENL